MKLTDITSGIMGIYETMFKEDYAIYILVFLLIAFIIIVKNMIF